MAVLMLSVYANDMRLGTKSAIVEHLTTKTAIFWLNALPFSGPTPIWLGAQFNILNKLPISSYTQVAPHTHQPLSSNL